MLGEMVFCADKAAVALAGLMHAAAVGAYDMAKVYLWANKAGESELAALARHPGASRELFAGLAEIYADTKAASSIRTTLLRSLGWLAVPELRDMVRGPGVRPVDAAEFAAARATLYLILRDGSSSVAAPLFRLICDLMHHEGNLAATRTATGGTSPACSSPSTRLPTSGCPSSPRSSPTPPGSGRSWRS